MAFSATPALADDYVFGSSGGSPWTLTINGTAYTSVDTGWIRQTGAHISSNDNYIVGSCCGYGFNNWGVFDLSNFSGTVNSAVLSLNSFSVTSSPVLYTLFDTSASLAMLDADRADGNVAGIALFNDLGSGVSYGSRTYTGADINSVQSIALNGAALSAIQSAAGGQFAMGGTLTPSTAALPEPATWSMMLLGFGLIGGFMRRKPKVTTRLSYT